MISKRVKRIGIDARLWNETGVGRYIRNLAKNLLLQDQKNEYIFFVLGRDYEVVKKELESKKTKLVKSDLKWHTISEQIKFPKTIQREKLDLMHFTYFSVPIFYKGPYVLTIHDLINHHFPTGKASTLPVALYLAKYEAYRIIIKRAAKNAKKIIVPSVATKRDVARTLRIPESKIVVTREGVDKDLRKGKVSPLVLKTKKPYFLYVGNAYPHKNLNILMEAFFEVKKDNPEISLIFVGREDFFYSQIKKKYSAQIEKSIHFLHDVSDSDIFFLYNNANALVAPSLMEGFGLTVLEAMASSCPVIASNIEAFQEVSGGSALFFNPRDASDLSQKMRQVIGMTSEQIDELRKKGKSQSSQFSWDTMVDKTIKVYESSISV